jgi:hypothetical protein
MVPLGYLSRDKKLVIEEDEAKRVRTIFGRYLEVGSIGRLLADLREPGIVTKIRHLSDGRTMGGIPFTRGPLAYLLRNRFGPIQDDGAPSARLASARARKSSAPAKASHPPCILLCRSRGRNTNCLLQFVTLGMTARARARIPRAPSHAWLGSERKRARKAGAPPA